MMNKSNKDMQQIKFGNKKAMKIMSNDMKNTVKNSIKTITGIEVVGREYSFLNETNMHHLKNQNFKVCFNTFGKKFLLYLTIFQEKSYTIFINRKDEDMIFININFNSSLYSNTLFDGEMIKNKDDEWLFVINDILMLKNENMKEKRSLKHRQEIMKNIFENEFKSDINDVCQIKLKEYFGLEYLEDLVNNYINNVSYRCSGLFFQHEIQSNKSFMFIFPENRTNEIKKDVIIPLPKPEKPKLTLDKNKPFKFWVNSTEMPDIYELYINKEDEDKIGIAGIPNYEISKLMSKKFEEIDEKIEMTFVFKENLNKWIPLLKDK